MLYVYINTTVYYDQVHGSKSRIINYCYMYFDFTGCHKHNNNNYFYIYATCIYWLRKREH